MAGWRNEADRVEDWHGKYTLSYPEYLTLQGYERSIRTAFDDQTDLLNAGHREALLEMGGALEETLAEGFVELDSSVRALRGSVEDLRQDISVGFAGVTSALYWGFGIVSSRLGHINDRLAELVSITRSPTSTWSNERYSLAHDALKRGQFSDALVYAKQATDGFGSNPGITTEWRYHYLLGDIYLGDFRNNSAEIIDLYGAEKAFLKAASCAELDNKLMSGRALIRAGRAAMIRGASAIAYTHTTAGLALVPTHAQGHYQAARLACELEDRPGIIKHLASALPINSSLLLSALDEPSFVGFEESIRAATERAAIVSKILYEDRKRVIMSAIVEAENYPLHFTKAREELLKISAGIRESLRDIDDFAEGDFADIEHGRLTLLDVVPEVSGLSDHAVAIFKKYAERTRSAALNLAKQKRDHIRSIHESASRLKEKGALEAKHSRSLTNVMTLAVFLGYIAWIVFVDFPHFQRGFSSDGEAISTIIRWPLILWAIISIGPWLSKNAGSSAIEARENEAVLLAKERPSFDAAVRQAEVDAFHWLNEGSNAAAHFKSLISMDEARKSGVIEDMS